MNTVLFLIMIFIGFILGGLILMFIQAFFKFLFEAFPLLMLSLMIIVFVALFYYFSSSNQKIVKVDKEEDKIENIIREKNRINNTLKNIDNLSIKEIRKELNKTQHFLSSIESETNNRIKLIKELELAIKEKKTDADSLSNLSDYHLNRVNEMLKDSQNDNFWKNNFWAFILGILSSLTASLAWQYRQRLFSKFKKDKTN